MEELETLKDDIYKEIKESNGLHIKKIEELQEIMFKMKNEKQDQRLFMASLEQYFRGIRKFINIIKRSQRKNEKS